MQVWQRQEQQRRDRQFVGQLLVLMHAGSQVESVTLDGLMTKIEQMGYSVVTVTQVLP